MRKAFIFCVVVLLSVAVYWQINDKEITTSSTLIELTNHTNYKTFEELRKSELEAKIKRKTSGVAKADKPNEFRKFHNRITKKPGSDSQRYAPSYKIDELNKARQKVALRSAQSPLNWRERGPGNVSGRTRALIVDPDDATCNTWIAGSVSGGVWRTTNTGQSWTNLTPNLPNLAIASLAMASSNTQVLYAGTGEGFFNGDAVSGDGIFKSSDKGGNWQQLAFTAGNDDFDAVNRIVVDPLDENTVIAVTNSSVQKSTDGGLVWRTVFTANYRPIQQIITVSNTLDTLYAAVWYGGVIKSTDRGENWDYVFNHQGGRIEIALSPTDLNVVYALDESSNLFMSEDFGSSWSATTIVSGSRDRFLGNQGGYDNTLAVWPSDPHQLLIGGLNLYNVEILSDSTYAQVGIDTIGTASFMSFTRFGQAYFGGAVDIGIDRYNNARIEIQFGEGKSQKAHRFTVPEGATSGVAAGDYTYQDYVEVPFEVWDVDNGKQLMLSFRDQTGNGVFDLTLLDDLLFQGREYFWVNDVPYSNSADPNIAVNGGHEYNYLLFTWPVLANGATWDPQNLPEAKIVLSTYDVGIKKISSEQMTSWYPSENGKPYVHADMHNVQFCKKENDATRIVLTHDGGVDYSDDEGGTWTNPQSGYNTTQFYGVDKKANEDRYVGGTQDNGSWYSPADPGPLSNWTEATGGDGFDAVWHPYTGEMITSYYYNALTKITADGQGWSELGNVPDVEPYAPFVTQIGYNPNVPNSLYLVGASGVSYSKDFGQSWYVSELTDSLWGWFFSGYVEPSVVSPEVVWAVSAMDIRANMMLSRDGGLSFAAAGATDERFNMLSGLATHPTNEKSAFALFSYPEESKILRTTDFGENWVDISGFEDSVSINGFPDVAVYSLLVMPHDTSIIWVGTEIGLFVSEDNGENWAYSNNGLPAVSIWEMKIRDQQVVLATHGRGIWTLDIPEIPVRPTLPFFMDVNMNFSNELSIDYVQAAEYDSLFLSIDSTLYSKLTIVSDYSEIQRVKVDAALVSGLHMMQLIAYKGQQVVKSDMWLYNSIPYNIASESYSNSFDKVDSDFIYEGMSVEDLGGLETTMAIHSSHPYPVGNGSSAILKTPIILQRNAQGHSTQLRYSDIPMVEEGEEGAEYGSLGFFDYVGVFASKDGKDWIPLADGYDFRAIKERASVLGLTVDSVPSNSLFEEKVIDLLTYFEVDDTILIRFYLYSDLGANGWGWVIDDINIGVDVPSSIEKQTSGDIKLYPIPCSEQLNVSFGESMDVPKELLIYDMNGKIVKRESLISEQNFSVDISVLKTACYILEIKSDRESFRRTFVVQR